MDSLAVLDGIPSKDSHRILASWDSCYNLYELPGVLGGVFG